MSWACQDQMTTLEISPTRMADSPSHSMNMPGASTSSSSKTAARITQFQVPSATIHCHMARSSGDALTCARAGRPPRRRRGRAALAVEPEGFLGDLADAGERAEHVHGLDRQHQHFLVRRLRQLAERTQILLSDEVVERGDVAAGDRLAHHLGGLGLGLGGALARLGIAERRFAAAFGLQDLRLLLAFGLEDRRLALALGLEDHRALLALGLHLP